MRRRLTISIAAIAILSLTIPAVGRSHTFPGVVPLPDGIQPEGIATGSGTEFFTGSLANGAIYKGDLRTGAGEFVNDPADFDAPRAALGMKHDPRSDVLWVAGGPTGQSYVYDAATGETLSVLELTGSQETFVNDVVVTRDSAFLTDSFQPVIYEVPLDQNGLPDGPIETHTLSGDFVFVPGPGVFNSNGIDATPNGKTLLLVNSATESVYTVDPDTATATEIELDSPVPNGDGILLDGKTLYVVQNFMNQIGVIELSPDLASGVVTKPITSPDFMIPTTIAEFGRHIYAVNARFDTPPGPDVTYDVVQVEKE